MKMTMKSLRAAVGNKNLSAMKPNQVNQSKYERALNRVKNIKGWYNHLIIYLIINTLLQFFYSGFFDNGSFTSYMPYWVRFTTPFFWGVSLIVHGVYVYKGHLLKRIFKKWEERKIRELMNDDVPPNFDRWE